MKILFGSAGRGKYLLYCLTFQELKIIIEFDFGGTKDYVSAICMLFPAFIAGIRIYWAGIT